MPSSSAQASSAFARASSWRSAASGSPWSRRARRRRAVEPELGLVPAAEPRRPRTADGDEEPGALGASEPRHHQDLGFRRCGLLYLSNDDAEIETWTNWCRFAREMGVTSHPLDATEATERGKGTGKTWKGGVFSPNDGIANPERAAPLIAEALVARGGHVLQNCAARGLELRGGRVSAVVTERGTIRTGAVVLAAGAWASSFCRQYGIRFPQASIRSSILSIAPGADLPDALHTSQVSITSAAPAGTRWRSRARRGSIPRRSRSASRPSFVPMFFKRRNALAPGGLEGWLSGHENASPVGAGPSYSHGEGPHSGSKVDEARPSGRWPAPAHFTRASTAFPWLPAGPATSTARPTAFPRSARPPRCPGSSWLPGSRVMASDRPGRWPADR